MSRNLDRLRKGERWWTAEFVLRGLGMFLLAGCYLLGTIAHRLLSTLPPHQATLGEFAICLATAICLTSGLALTLFGPRLCEHVPIPSGNPRYWKF